MPFRGATMVLVGIGADIAQTIVQLGIDLSDIVTQADLRLGVTYALNRQRLAIRYGGRASLQTGPVPDGWRAEIRLPR